MRGWLNPADERSGPLEGSIPQGGPMTSTQARAFEAEPFFADAVRLRRWDEEGKIVGYQGPGAAHFDAVVVASLEAA